jgi:uncharacterized OsmC-like protein
MSASPSISRSLVPLEECQFPRAFPFAQRRTQPAMGYMKSGKDTFRCEVLGIGRYQKEALVEEASSGRIWRLTADEGRYLKGTDLAPAPLMHWGAGLHADATLRIASLARVRNIKLERLSVIVRQGFASKGSFVKGEAVGLVFGLTWEVTIDASCDADQLRAVVSDGIAASPAAHAMRSPQEGTFALYTNGHRTHVEGMRASDDTAQLDPMATHRDAVEPTAEMVWPTILTQLAGTGTSSIILENDSSSSIGFHVNAEGHLDLQTGLVHSTVGFPEAVGSSRWTLVSDPQGIVAPHPLGYFAVGTAFCFHTQLCRYIAVRRLSLEAARMVQISPFSVAFESGRWGGRSDPLDTHLFLNGDASDEETRSLLPVAANTCYAHRALGTQIETVTTVVTNGLSRKLGE